MSRIVLFLMAITIALAPNAYAQFPYQDTKLSPEMRATDLLSRLTLEEKAALMQHNSPAIPRLGIKGYNWWNEALHGVGRAGLATVFPQAIGMGASFNPALLFDVFTAVSDEARAKSNAASQRGSLRQYLGLTYWTPNVNIFRDPRWGRGQETYGEDPYLTGILGMEVVKGLQGPDDAPYDKLHACAKHFAVHSGPEWNRHSFNAENIDQRDLWETYLPAFKDLVTKANVKEVMCAYNRYEGDPCCGSNRLLTQILRDQWQFKGLVVSDCWAISDFYRTNAHATHETAAHASASAVLNGTDVECGSDYRQLPVAVRSGLIDEKQIDVSVKRLLKARFELGEMNQEPAWDTPMSVVNSPKHQNLALQMARQSIVLLQNKNKILPLKKNLTIAVMGPNANDSVMQWGNYNGTPAHTVTLLEALKQRFPAAKLIYEQGCDRTNDQAISSLFSLCRFNDKNGFQADYWNNTFSEGEPIATVYEPTSIRLTTMGATPFAAGVNIHDFSARYRTQFKPSKTEEVVFRFQISGRASMTINGETVVRSVSASGTVDAYTLKAESGKTYDIDISYTSRQGDAVFNFDFGPLVPMDVTQSVEKIKGADVVIFAGGIAPSLEGEEMRVTIPGFKGGDRTDIELPAIQRRLLNALKLAGKKVVFVNFSGSAMGLVPETASCDAILQAWYPGQAGGTAIADVLLGVYNPSGKLPVTFYRNVSQLPDFESYSMKNRTYRFFEGKPLYPFGYGLNYAKFKIGKAKISQKNITKGDTVKLTIPIKNTSAVMGEEVVQIYLRKIGDLTGPLKTLRAFKKVELLAGKKQWIDIVLTPDQLEWFDIDTNTICYSKGMYEILYGNSSSMEGLKSLIVTLN